jgi:hypothetical protein
MKKKPVIKNMDLLPKNHSGFDPNFKDLVCNENSQNDENGSGCN